MEAQTIRPLRPHQTIAIDAVRNSVIAGIRRYKAGLFATVARTMLQLPTGAGKTRIAAEIIKSALDKGKRVAFIVPAISLVDQTVAAFEAEGLLDIGVLQASHPRKNPHARIQVCSI